jgi:membrane associated rhomboid family serine protease
VATQTVSAKGIAKRADFPIVTWSMIALNVAVFIAILAVPEELRSKEIYEPFGLVARRAQFFSMLTSSFLHDGPLHLLGNMLFLWLFGRALERALGAVEYIMLYVGSGLFAAVTHLAIVYAFLSRDIAAVPSVGASGAIAGLLGMYAIRFSRQKFVVAGVAVPSALLLLGWLVLQVVMGIVMLYNPNPRFISVDYWSHMGGFTFGMIVAYLTHTVAVSRKEYLLTDAEESYKRGTLLDVIRKYETLLRYDPKDPFTLAELARTWALLDDSEEACKYYETAVNLYLDTGKLEDAVNRCQELLRLLPHCTVSAPLLYRISSYLEVSDPEGAILALSGINTWHPSSPESEMAFLKIAQLQLHRLNQPETAIATVDQFLEMYPNSQLNDEAKKTLQIACSELAQQAPQDDHQVN